MAGPNIKSHQANYDKFQVKSSNMSVPDYKVANNNNNNNWNNTYNKMQTNSHPDFKPIYGPQDNKRPYNEMMDIYNNHKDKEDDLNKVKPVQDEVKRHNSAKGKKEQILKKINDPVSPEEKTNERYNDTPKKDNTKKDDRILNNKKRSRKMKTKGKANHERKAKIIKTSLDNTIKECAFLKSDSRKPFDKNALVGPNVKSYNNAYDRKFPFKSNNMAVPDYNSTNENKWQKSYSKMHSTSHPDFHPIYGPQNNKRKIDMLDMYQEAQEKEKNVEQFKEKKDKLLKEKTHEKERIEEVHQDKSPWHENEKRYRNDTEKSPQRDEKVNDNPRKDNKETLRHDSHKEDYLKYEDKNVDKDSPRDEKDHDEDKYYGYHEMPVKNDERKEPVMKNLHQSKLQSKRQEPGQDHLKEGKSIPKEDKAEKKHKQENKMDENKDKKEDRVNQKEKKDPYDDWKRDGRVNAPAKVSDPYSYRRHEEQEKPDTKKEVKSNLRENKVAPKDDTRKDTNDPYKYKGRSEIQDNPQKEMHKDPKKDEIQKQGREINTEVKEKPKKEMQYNREREQKAKRDEDSHLYTSRDHERPSKTQNNKTSIVRDGGYHKVEKGSKPTAKITPTTRETWDEKKWPTEKEMRKVYEHVSMRKQRECLDMDDVLQDKIITELRKNGIAETKVIPLSAKITQAARDDVIDSNQKISPQVTANLTEVINKYLDPILFNKVNVTDLRDSQKSSDARHLSNLVLLRIGQVHEEIELCKLSVDDPRNRKGKGQTPRDEPQDRSSIMALKDGIEKQKTERDILKDKLRHAHKETQEVEDVMMRKQGELQNLDSDNWQLKHDLSGAEQSKQSLLTKLKEQQRDFDSLDKQHQEIRQENLKLKSRLNESDGQSQIMSGELAKLQSENAKLKVLTNQKEKEIIHLRDPDKDMVHKIRILSDEVTMLRTQTRRLNEEKALLKSRSQKMESSLEESNRQKGKLSVEKDNLFKENQELKQHYRKLALANPQQRTLPDIMTGRNAPSSHGTPRTNSRSLSRNIRNSDDRRMSAAEEEDDEDEAYGR